MRIWKDVWDYAKMIIIVVLIVTLINNVVLINAKIPSESMEKTVMTGDRLFGFRLAYGINIDLFGHEISKKIKDPERFDIIIFKYPDDEKKTLHQAPHRTPWRKSPDHRRKSLHQRLRNPTGRQLHP